MRVIVMGQQVFGKAALEKILEPGVDEVVAVYTAPDKEGKPADPMKQAAINHKLALYQPANFKDDAVLDEMRALNADVMIMAFVTVFVPEAARDIPKMGSICFHPSLLPLHRGPSAINWSIIWGETKTGLCWFYPTDGLDEGEILLMKEVEIGPDDTLGDVYFKKIFPLGVDSTLEVLDMYRGNKLVRIGQDETKATYESWCRKKESQIDWSKPVADVYNLIRGTNPQPGAWTTIGGEELQIFDARKTDGAGTPGDVVSIGDDGVVVQADGGRIIVKRVRAKGGDKIPAGQWAAGADIKPGSKLSN
ncbi:MAG: methionyl-tRNA formyltransferase [Proteobacteria bacterium]|nr:methionyl-tRNA formyltransferase [Pseudomonadota bacterium]